MATAILLAALPAQAQEGGGHTLFGDLKVDQRGDAALRPATFQVVLYTFAGMVVARQTLAPNGRYRFMNIKNGDYQLVVELEDLEVVRMPLNVFMLKQTEIRRDIELEWKEDPRYRKKPESPTVPLQEYYKRGPENADRWEKALKASERQEHAEAIGHLNRIVASDPEDYSAWTELGSVHHNRGDFAEAEKAYERALKLSPSFARALLNYGKLRMAERRYDQAVDLLARSAELKPDVAEAHLLLGEAYLQLKKGSRAVAPLNEAIRLDPAGMAEAHLRLAALYNAAGLKDKAAEEYEKFLAKQPDFPDREKLLQYIRENKP